MTVDDTYGTELFILSQSHIKIVIDVVWGSGVLQAQDLTDLEEDDKSLSSFILMKSRMLLCYGILVRHPLMALRYGRQSFM